MHKQAHIMKLTCDEKNKTKETEDQQPNEGTGGGDWKLAGLDREW